MEPLRGTTDMREHKFGLLFFPTPVGIKFGLRLTFTVRKDETPKGDKIIQDSLFIVNELSGGG